MYFEWRQGIDIITWKKALITGITGQDGAYLADLLLKKLRPINEIKGYIEIGKQKDYMCNIS